MADNENTPPRLRPCANCGKPAVERYKPFCSSRCADIDLGRWLKGSYVIPGEAVEDTQTSLPPGDRDDEG